MCVIFLGVAWASGGSAVWTNAAMLVLGLTASVICVALGQFAQRSFGKIDPGQCTADEWAGQCVALLLIPLGSNLRERLIAVGVAFLLFRIADILKPPPARQLEKLPYGWGVLLDDLAAGLYANIAAQLILRF